MSRRIYRSKSRSLVYPNQRRNRYIRKMQIFLRQSHSKFFQRSKPRMAMIRSEGSSRSSSSPPLHRPRNINIIQSSNRQHLSHPPSFDPSHEFGLSQNWGETPTGTSPTDWPQGMGPVLVISIRPERMNKFAQRMGPWMKHMKRFPSTDGRTINIRHWVSSRKVLYSKMSPGRMGCYDSHVRIWETIARSQYPVVTVLEDDVDLDYAQSSQLCSKINQSLQELNCNHVLWDFLCWGHGPWAFGKNIPFQGLSMWRKPGMCQGFFAYTLTRSMAQKLVTQCRPYKGTAVDKWFYDDFIKKNAVTVLSLEPGICWVVTGESDTGVKRMKK